MPYLGELCALLTACCWSGSALAFSAAAVRVGSVRLNVTRLIMAGVILLVIVLAARIDIRLSTSQVGNLVASGIIGLVIGDTFLFKSYENIGARLGMLIMSVAPAASALLAYLFLGEVLSVMAIVGMTITLSGIALVVLERRETITRSRRVYLTGIVFGIVAAASQGGGLVLAKMAFNEGPVNGIAATLIRIVAAIVVIFPLAKLAGEYRDTPAIYRKDRHALVMTLIGAVLGPVFGITLSLISVSLTTVGVAATLMSIVPILMLPLVRYVQKEPVSWRALAGAVVAVGGVAILFLR